jgi:hypothetical protein
LLATAEKLTKGKGSASQFILNNYATSPTH